MTEIKVQEKRSRGWGWLIGLVALALLIWGAAELFDRDDEFDDTAVVETETPPVSENVAEAPEAPPIMVVTIVGTPESYAGQQVTGTATVAEVISDRGFWIEQDGQRMFAIIDEPVPEIIDINPGQQVHLTGTVYTNPDELTAPIEDDARAAIQDQPAFLYVRADDIRITDRPAR